MEDERKGVEVLAVRRGIRKAKFFGEGMARITAIHECLDRACVYFSLGGKTESDSEQIASVDAAIHALKEARERIDGLLDLLIEKKPWQEEVEG